MVPIKKIDMDIKQIKGIGKELNAFLSHFVYYFSRSGSRRNLSAYVNGQMSNLPQKSIEPIALLLVCCLGLCSVSFPYFCGIINAFGIHFNGLWLMNVPIHQQLDLLMIRVIPRKVAIPPLYSGNGAATPARPTIVLSGLYCIYTRGFSVHPRKRCISA